MLGPDDGGEGIVKLAVRMLGLVQGIEFHDAPADSIVAAHFAMLAGYTALVAASQFMAAAFSAPEVERVRALAPEIARRLRVELGEFSKNRGEA